MTQEVVKWKDSKTPAWFPIDRKKGIVVTGHIICKNLTEDMKEVGELIFSGEPIFSKPVVTFWEELLKTLRIRSSSECARCRQQKDPRHPVTMKLIYCNDEWDIWRCPQCFDTWKAPCNFDEDYS